MKKACRKKKTSFHIHCAESRSVCDWDTLKQLLNINPNSNNIKYYFLYKESVHRIIFPFDY